MAEGHEVTFCHARLLARWGLGPDPERQRGVWRRGWRGPTHHSKRGPATLLAPKAKKPRAGSCNQPSPRDTGPVGRRGGPPCSLASATRRWKAHTGVRDTAPRRVGNDAQGPRRRPCQGPGQVSAAKPLATLGVWPQPPPPYDLAPQNAATRLSTAQAPRLGWLPRVVERSPRSAHSTNCRAGRRHRWLGFAP